MNNSTLVIIPLDDAVRLLQEGVRENTPRQFSYKTVEYDCRNYLKSLLDAIFSNSRPTSSAMGVTPSAQHLIDHGVEMQTAVYLDNEVFKAVVDSIAAHLPGIEFGKKTGVEHYLSAGEELHLSIHPQALQAI